MMTLEILEKLESKVQQAVDTIALLNLELEELKEKNDSLAVEGQAQREQRETLEQENAKLRADHDAWQQRIRSLLGKIEEVE